MDGLANIAGAGAEIEIAGKVYALPALGLGDWAAAERHVAELRGNPLRPAAAVLDDPNVSPETKAAVLSAALASVTAARGTAETGEVLEFLATPTGTCYFAWLSLRKAGDEFKEFAAVETLLAALPFWRMSELRYKVQLAAGLVALQALEKN